jgi:hypothetical protein
MAKAVKRQGPEMTTTFTTATAASQNTERPFM